MTASRGHRDGAFAPPQGIFEVDGRPMYAIMLGNPDVARRPRTRHVDPIDAVLAPMYRVERDGWLLGYTDGTRGHARTRLRTTYEAAVAIIDPDKSYTVVVIDTVVGPGSVARRVERILIYLAAAFDESRNPVRDGVALAVAAFLHEMAPAWLDRWPRRVDRYEPVREHPQPDPWTFVSDDLGPEWRVWRQDDRGWWPADVRNAAAAWEWASAGFGPEDAKEWIGFQTAAIAAVWKATGLGQALAIEWCSATRKASQGRARGGDAALAEGAARLHAAGFRPADLAAFSQIPSNRPSDLTLLMKGTSGVPDHLLRLATRAGYSMSETRALLKGARSEAGRSDLIESWVLMGAIRAEPEDRA